MVNFTKPSSFQKIFSLSHIPHSRNGQWPLSLMNRLRAQHSVEENGLQTKITASSVASLNGLSSHLMGRRMRRPANMDFVFRQQCLQPYPSSAAAQRMSTTQLDGEGDIRVHAQNRMQRLEGLALDLS